MTRDNKPYTLFTPSGCLKLRGIEDYLNGSLTDFEMQETDRHLAQCDLCKEAMEGIAIMPDKKELGNVIREISQNLSGQMKLKGYHTGHKQSLLHNKLFYFAAAASIVILIGLLFFLNKPINLNDNIPDTAYEMQIVEKKIPPIPKAQKTLGRLDNEIQIKKDQEVTGTSQKAVKPSPKNQKTHSTDKNRQKIEPIKLNGEDLRSGDRSLETFRKAIKDPDPTEPMDIPGEYPDIASIQPIEYYLAEVIVNDQTPSNGFKHQELLNNRSTDIQTSVAHLGRTQHESRNQSKGKWKEQDVALQQNDQSGQNPDNISERDSLSQSAHFFTLVETMPEFPGGYEGLNAYLSKNLTFPASARKQKIQGRVVISFIIDDDGLITNVRKIRGIGGGCDEEAMRIIQSMPSWKPAIQNGKTVSVMFTLPVYFRIL